MKKNALQELWPPVPMKEKVFTAVVIWLFGLIAFVAYFGLWPRTGLAWILLLFAAPPLYLIAEAVGELCAHILSRIPIIRIMTDSIEGATREKRFSWLRVCYYLVGGLMICAVIIGVMHASDLVLDGKLHPLKDFLKQHFSSWW